MKLTINEKEYGLSWGLGAIEIYCDAVGCDVGDMDIDITSSKVMTRLKAINTLTLAAIQNWCELNNVDFDLTYRGFQNWLNDQPQDTANEILEDWKASKMFGKTIAETYFFTETKTDKKKEQSLSEK